MSGITRKNKLYCRPSLKNHDQINNLEKLSPILYAFISELFIEKGYNKKYLELNKGVESWSLLEALPFQLDAEMSKEMQRVTKLKSITIYYNNTYRPLIRLTKSK